METKYLSLKPIELIEMVNMTGEDHIFEVGEQPGQYSETALLKLMNREEAQVISALPNSMKQMVKGNIMGEYLTPDLGALAGTTSLQTNFYPIVEDSEILFLNFEQAGEPFRALNRYSECVIPKDQYTIDYETGEIELLVPLSQGDTVVLNSTAMPGHRFESLKSLVLKFCRLELKATTQNWNDGVSSIDQEREALEDKLILLGTPGGPGLIEVDGVTMVNNSPGSRTYRLPFLGGR